MRSKWLFAIFLTVQFLLAAPAFAFAADEGASNGGTSAASGNAALADQQGDRLGDAAPGSSVPVDQAAVPDQQDDRLGDAVPAQPGQAAELDTPALQETPGAIGKEPAGSGFAGQAPAREDTVPQLPGSSSQEAASDPFVPGDQAAQAPAREEATCEEAPGETQAPAREETPCEEAPGEAPSPAIQPESITPSDSGEPMAEDAELKQADSNYEATHVNMYRMYNPNSGEHFYTGNFAEARHLLEIGWQWEGIGWVAPSYSNLPVYRLYNPNAGDHHYTLSAYERDVLKRKGWNYEGIGWYSDGKTQIPIYRQYNPNAKAGAHNFTASSYEHNSLVKMGWRGEGTAWYATRGDYVAVPTCWVTSPSWGGRYRYWIGPDGQIAKSRLVTIAEGSPYCAMVDQKGHIISGQVIDASGTVFAADSSGVIAPMLSLMFGADSQGYGLRQKVSSLVSGMTTYLMLPSYVTLADAVLSLTHIDGSTSGSVVIAGNGVSAAVSQGTHLNLASLDDALQNTGQLNFTMTYYGKNYALAIMRSANIGALYLNSQDAGSRGRRYVEASSDHSAKANVAVTLVGSNGAMVYDMDSQSGGAKYSTVKGRGNSTWAASDKKPYQISLGTAYDLVGGSSAEAAKKWILLANSGDPSLMRNAIALDLGRELGLAGCNGTFVDLYYDGEYRGNYYLCEKVEVGAGRVEIADLEAALKAANPGVKLDSASTAKATNRYGYVYQYGVGIADPADITGGYLIELDKAYYSTEMCWFNTSVGQFVVKAPEACSRNCMIYISEYVQQALNNLSSNVFNQGASFDLESLARVYLVNDVLKNVDAFFSSTFFYKDAGDGPLYSGPLWDFDACMGTRIDEGTLDYRKFEGFALVNATWVMKSTVLKNKVKSLYRTELSPLMHNVLLGGWGATGPRGQLRSIEYYRNLIYRSAGMNSKLPYGYRYINQIARFETYDLNVRYLVKWLGYRTQWLDLYIDNLREARLSNPTSTYKGKDYSDVYDYYYYLDHNPDVRAAFGGDTAKTLEHFVTCGMKEGRQGSLNFNVQAYRNAYADLRKAFGNNLASYYLHYVDCGFKEGRLL